MNNNTKTTAIVEAYQTIREKLCSKLSESSGCRVITVCSPSEEDGKTTTAINLAVALSKGGFKTLIIDTDLKNGIVEKKLNVSAEFGLCDLLYGKCTLDGAIISVAASLELISSGTHISSIDKLICSEEFEDLISSLRFVYDYIIIDTGAACPSKSVVFSAKQSDGAVLVVREGKTSHKKISAAIKALRDNSVFLIGSIINASKESL